jgi:hypothetical protein
MATDARTTSRNYPKPHVDNQISEEFPRLITAMDMIDADVDEALTALDDKSAVGHTHAIADTSGLQSALDDKSAVGHTHTLNELSDVTVSGAATGQVLSLGADGWQPVTLTVGSVSGLQSALDGPLAGLRNKIINGNFDHWERGTSLAAGTGFRYLADRFYLLSTGSTNTPSRQAFSAGQIAVLGEPEFFHRSVISSSTGAGNYAVMGQYIEDVRTCAGKVITVSFWAKADASKPISVEMGQRFGTGGSAGVDISSQKINLTSSWQKFTLNFAIPSISGKTLGPTNTTSIYILWWFDAGTNFSARSVALGHQSGTFDIAQVQLEEGPVATPFEQRPIGLELALCQRYFAVIGTVWPTNHGAASQLGMIYHPVTMRVTPTYASTNANGNTLIPVGPLAGYIFKDVTDGLEAFDLTAHAEL